MERRDGTGFLGREITPRRQFPVITCFSNDGELRILPGRRRF